MTTKENNPFTYTLNGTWFEVIYQGESVASGSGLTRSSLQSMVELANFAFSTGRLKGLKYVNGLLNGEKVNESK